MTSLLCYALTGPAGSALLASTVRSLSGWGDVVVPQGPPRYALHLAIPSNAPGQKQVIQP